MQEIRRRGLKVAVAGIPNTIDNDIPVLPIPINDLSDVFDLNIAFTLGSSLNFGFHTCFYLGYRQILWFRHCC